MAKKPEPKKEPKPFLVKKAKPAPKQPVGQHEWQCMWGCGYSAGDMNTTRSHESGCANKPN